MPYRNNVKFTTVASGDQVSGAVTIREHDLLAVWSPTCDSCQMFFMGSYDTASANFIRIGDSDTTISDLSWNVSVGSRTIAISDHIAPYVEIKFEYSVAQTDTRTIVVITEQLG